MGESIWERLESLAKERGWGTEMVRGADLMSEVRYTIGPARGRGDTPEDAAWDAALALRNHGIADVLNDADRRRYEAELRAVAAESVEHERRVAEQRQQAERKQTEHDRLVAQREAKCPAGYDMRVREVDRLLARPTRASLGWLAAAVVVALAAGSIAGVLMFGTEDSSFQSAHVVPYAVSGAVCLGVWCAWAARRWKAASELGHLQRQRETLRLQRGCGNRSCRQCYGGSSF